MAHKLPPLRFGYDALEPYIDAETMELHHDKHHAAYVDNLNKTLEPSSSPSSRSRTCCIASTRCRTRSGPRSGTTPGATSTISSSGTSLDRPRTDRRRARSPTPSRGTSARSSSFSLSLPTRPRHTSARDGRSSS
jgi:Iron/manganese superoxide dismutases, alpha-hairpin domain